MRGAGFLRGYLLAAAVLSMLEVTGCGLPEAGPGIGTMTRKEQLRDRKALFSSLVTQDVSMEDAIRMAEQDRREEKERIRAAVHAINIGRHDGNPVAHAGDNITVSILSFPAAGDAAGTAPAFMKLGSFRVLRDGTVALPYVNSVHVAGLTYARIQRRLSRLYAARGLFNTPSVIVRSDSSGGSRVADSILVVGQVTRPREIAWLPGGMTLAHVLAVAMSDGSISSARPGGDDGLHTARYRLSVSIVRGGRVVGTVPLEDALTIDMSLAPRDRVIVKKEASISVPVLGGGVSRPGLYAFGASPSLAEVLAMSGGLKGDAASSRAVFVLRYERNIPHLMKVPFDRAYGLFVAQKFLLKRDDIVYVAESPWVPYSKVFSLILQAGVLASIAR